MKNISKLELTAAPLPLKTYSYTPVSHEILLNTIEEKLYSKNLKITGKQFDASANFNQMFGVYEIGRGNGSEKMNIGFRNSYDKSLAVGLVAGATVIVCSNLMFRGDVRILRKHTNGVFTDLEKLVGDVVELTEKNFNDLQIDKHLMEKVSMSKDDMAELAGRMFINENLITSTQLSVIKKEIHFSENFTDPSLWDFYNHCTEALKLAHPSEVLQSHIKVHEFVLQTV